MFDRSGKLRLLWAFMRGQRLRYFGAIAAMLAATLILYLVPLVAAAVIDFVIQHKPFTQAPAWLQGMARLLGGPSELARSLWIASLAIVALTAAGGIFNYLKGRWSAQASEAIALRLRDRLYDHIQQLPCSYHDKTDTGELVQRCTSDVETVRSFLAVQVVEIARAVLMLITVLPFMLALSPRLTLLAMALIPLIIGFTLVFLSRVTTAFRLSDEAEGRLTTVLQENLMGIRVVRAFARQDHECRKFAVVNEKFRATTVRLIDLMAWYWSASDYTCHVQNALVLVFGGYWAMEGRIDVGTLFAFIAYEGMLLWPIRQMGRLLTELGKTTVSMGRLRDILRNPDEDGRAAPEVDSRGTAFQAVPAQAGKPVLLETHDRDGHATHGQDLSGVASAKPDGRATHGRDAHAAATPLKGDIALRNLSFSFGDARPVLAGVTFDAPAGQTVAILGPSGSGKSTLMHLLLRLYEYQQGSIAIDGQELRDMDRHFLRLQIGVVLQEPFLYSKSLRENIELGGRAEEDRRIAEAASDAAIHDSILSFEKGYDTIVGERGVTLSGGQRQRVALARAILKDPPILILDDALSAVDTRTESLILSALRRRHGRRTTLVIAHRLSTLMQADRIVVLEHGRVVQSGTHQSLLKEEGLYGRLWKIQSNLEEDLREEIQGARPGGATDA